MTYAQAIEKYQKILMAYHYEISDDSKHAISLYEQSGSIDSALELLSDGLISNEDFILLLEISDKTDLCPFFEDYKKEIAEIQLPEDTRKKLFALCFNTYNSNYPILPIKFSEALMLSGKTHLRISISGFLTCDKELSIILIELGANLFIIENGDVHYCSKEDVFDCSDNSILIPDNYMTAYSVAKVLNGQHFQDFYVFCQKNHISADSKFEEKYLAYVKRIKLMFSIQLYKPYRHICGDNANILDYVKNAEYSDEISLDIEHGDSSESTLIADVKSMCLRRRSIVHNDVVEIRNDNQIRHFVYRKADTDNGYSFDEAKDFLSPLFNETAIMEVLNSYHGEIKTDGDKEVIVPDKIKEQLTDAQLTVAKNILCQKLQTIKKKETDKQKLTDILLQVKNKQNEQEAQRKQEAEQKKSQKKNSPVEN